MSSIFGRWKNQLRCSNKRYIHHSRSSMLIDTEFKTVNMTMNKLQTENRVLKDRFDKLETRCQQWIADEQIYLLKRIEQLEEENQRLRENYRTYQIQSEKCIGSVTDLIVKTLFTQEELRKQCTNLHQAIDTVKLRKKKCSQDESITRGKRTNSCQLTSNQLNDDPHRNRHTTNDQSTWLHQHLLIVEETDHPTELHITESKSSVYSPPMATTTGKVKSRIPSAGLANELYFASHKPDGDCEQTPTVLLRDKRRALQSNLVSTETTPLTPNTRRPISSPIRSTTYVLQQHHRITNNTNTNYINRKHSSPVRQNQSSPTTLITSNTSRQTQQQCTYSNHERLPPTIQSSTTTHTPITSRRPSPIVKNTPTKSTATTPRPSRIPTTSTVRPSRPSPAPPTPTVPSRSPRIPIRSANPITTVAKTISSSPTTNKSTRPRYTLSKSPEPLRSVTGALTRPRAAHTIVNKSRLGTTNTAASPLKTPIMQQPSSTTPRVSDLDALMATKQTTCPSPRPVECKSMTKPTPSPLASTIRRSLFSTDAVKLVRPVRSQELKIFSCHLTIDTTPIESVSDDISSHSTNTDDTHSTLTVPSSLDHQTVDNNDDSSSNASVLLRELSEDSLNEHRHIKQLLQNNASITAIPNDCSSNDDLPLSTAVTSWSRIRSSCESNLSQLAPLASEVSVSPAFYHGPIRQENIQMVNDGRYFLLIDDNLTSEDHATTTSSSSSSSSASALISPLVSTERKCLIHRLVFPERLGRVLFYRRTLSDSDIYQKLCSKDNEIDHNVYHLDTIRDYSMEFYMLTTYASDSQLRAWFDNCSEDNGNGTYYFDDHRFQSSDDDDDDDEDFNENRRKRISSSGSIIHEEEFHRLQADQELDWYSELESFNLSPNHQQWKQENASSCSSEDHVGELLRAEQFSVSSLTTTTSAESSCSVGLTSTSWPLSNGTHYQLHSSRSSQSLGSPPSSNIDEQSHTIIKEILTYPWTNEISHSIPNSTEIDHDHARSSSVVADQFQPDFYYLCPLKNTTSFLKTDDKANGVHRQLSHDV